MEIHRATIQKHNAETQKKANEKDIHSNQKRVQDAFQDEFKNIPEPFKKAAQGIEQQFVEFMVQQMHKTTGSEESSTALDYYNDLLYKQESEKMTNYKNGLGIQKVILDQIYPKKFRNEQALAAFNAQSNAVGKKKFIRMDDQPQNKEVKMSTTSTQTPDREDNHE